MLYFRLACSGIRKNRKLYAPYLLTVIGMVMMSHIMQSLSYSPALRAMRGGNQLEMILSLGKLVIAVFAGFFLLYTNSFLIRRRYREFGLYNVLGMDKNALCRVVLWENLIVAFAGLTIGLVLGTLLYKLAELGLVNMIRGQVDYSIVVKPESLGFTLIIFAIIFALIMVRSLLQVRLSRPLELLRSESAGEKPPRANYLLGLLGLALLGGAYYIAVTTNNGIDALLLFFVAVLMVIAGTYLVMISGSVVLCRLLQKCKGYYYKKQHFVSLSSMTYRMKRNGAGLASICILATMVLVMISSTASLYIGAEDALSTRYPHDSGFSVDMEKLEWMDEAHTGEVLSAIRRANAESDAAPVAEEFYRYASVSGALPGDTLQPDVTSAETVVSYSDVRTLMFLPQEDYNRLSGAQVSLQPGQALLGTYGCSYHQSSLTVGDVTLEITGQVPQELVTGFMTASVVPTLTLVLPDLQILEPLEPMMYGNMKMLDLCFYYGADFDLPDEQVVQLHNRTKEILKTIPMAAEGIGWQGECPAQERDDFFVTFGGLFFIGIMLSVIFIAAAALIIYYKQISEGYEDQARFAIMRKVGMTRQDIKKSVNSQVLTVFFTPLLLSGVHLIFAFPMVWLLLQNFSLRNRPLVVMTTAAAFLIFCVFYVIIYKFTAHAYYRIVSGSERK